MFIWFVWIGVKNIFTIVTFRSSRTDLHSKARCLFKNAPALIFFSYGKKTDPGFHCFFFLAVNCVRLHTCNHTLEVLYSLSSDNTLMFKCPYFLTEPHITADVIFRRNLCYIRQNLIFMLSLCRIITVCWIYSILCPVFPDASRVYKKIWVTWCSTTSP